MSAERSTPVKMNVDVPDTWEWAEVSKLSRNISLSGKKLQSKDYQPNGPYPVIDQSQAFVSGFSSKSTLLLEVDTPTIVFGDHTRVVKYVDFSFIPGADGIKVLQPLGLFPKYFSYALQATPLPDRGYARHFQFLNNALVPVPPLPEQHRIVAKIEELFTKLDAGVAALKKTQTLLKRYRQAVLKAAVEGELSKEWREANPNVEAEEGFVLYENSRTQDNTKFPRAWVQIKLGSLALLITKGSSPNWQGFEYVNEGIPFVRSQNVGWGAFTLKDVAFLPKEFNTKQRKSIIRQGDILLNIVGASIGRAAIAPREVDGGNSNQAVALIRLANQQFAPYILLYLISSPGQALIHREKVDVARANISLADIGGLLIPIPPAQEQDIIVDEVERQLSVIDVLEETVDSELKRSEQLRRAILKKAFSGQLVPQNSDDEPASVLLERIKAEKQESTSGRVKSGKRTKQEKLFS